MIAISELVWDHSSSSSHCFHLWMATSGRPESCRVAVNGLIATCTSQNDRYPSTKILRSVGNSSSELSPLGSCSARTTRNASSWGRYRSLTAVKDRKSRDHSHKVFSKSSSQLSGGGKSTTISRRSIER